ncbi:aminotransferase class I/II-fold pyridoxal phosphate-dependent enzyme [Fibrobacter sp. UWB12]|uniref:aminotransferase class I/II-fold pyridoxal phosphate-dependent enzyme n=1 Tax=Fibrobacter sp. UWB12 TaxID=1896203 RepID=UPI000919E504|nr:aminotransferase class I/II-fold pyridoxal phosphate-dependent enzyme [Fibrobacter sp. UWB12]SHK26691.1 Histidinol-phosphate/aromatic aminotransferase or cobyric acid decarboxylase [Fibrobacter sp. UWB12]
MQAVILAAGMGKRLGEYTKNNTKCMVPVNGTPLIDRTLNQLSKLGLTRVVIVVGYEGKKLMDYLGTERNGLKIEYVNNPIYDKTNNIYSLALAKEQLQEDDSLLIESDLIFDDGMFNLLLDNPFPNLALVAKYETWMDGTMVKLDRENNIVNFVTKAAFSYGEVGCYYKTVNIYKFSKEFSRTKYVPFLDAYCKAIGNNEYYENVLRIISFLSKSDLKALPITNEKWYEIDDKQDLDIAEALFAEEKDILRKYYGRYGGFWRFPKMLDYCYLVNPYFRNSRIIDEMNANFRTLIGEYPSGMKVNTLLASKCWGVKEEYVIPGNGAAELIKALMEDLPGTLGVTRPTFEEYPNRRNPETLVTFVPKNADYRYSAKDLMEFFGKNHADNLLLINPDNPSGNFIPKKDILTLAEWCEKNGTRLIVDESFVDFSHGYEDNSLLDDKILEAHPHLVVMKSISKSYGVPGIRLGILCSADKDLIAKMKKVVSIWNLNSFAEFFMQIYTKYEKDYNLACEQFIEERDAFGDELRKIKFLRVMPSEANYFLCEILPPKNANSLVLTMLKKYNILTRDCSDKKGFDGKQYMRIAVRSHEDNARLLKAFKELDK